jgi:oxygen-dependent protoporphyrinogen oxidase
MGNQATKRHILVIGGGLAGTAAANTLVKHGYKVTIVDKNNYLGGRIRTQLVDGAAVEMGAGFMTNAYTNLRAFLASSGLDDRLYRQRGSSGIFRDGQVRMATLGTLMGNSTLSWGAKLHVMPLLLKVLTSWSHLDPHAFWKADRYDNRSAADIFSSPSGKEFLEYVLQPILNGYFYWTPEQTSEAMLRILGKGTFANDSYKMQGGLHQIPEKAAEDCTVLLGHAVKKVRRNSNKSYTITVDHEGKRRTLQADGVVCATTASAVPRIFNNLTERLRQFFDAVGYSSTVLTARTYGRAQTRGDRGVAFPRQEGIKLAAVSVSPEPGANGLALATVKTYASGAIGKELCKQSDKAIVQTLIEAMEPVRKAVLIDSPEPLVTHIQRWPEALPLFDVGHFKRLQAFENGEIEDQTQPIVFAGDYLGGPFMEGAYTSGVNAARRLVGRMRG